VKWDVTLKKDMVDLGDCKKYDEMDVSQRKRKSKDFYFDTTDKKCKANKKSDELLNPPMGQMKNMFYSEVNSSKLCAEGAIGNLMNMLHCSKDDMELFWELATSVSLLIMESLNESNVLKKVFTPGLDIDSIEKCPFYSFLKVQLCHQNKRKGHSFPVIEAYFSGTLRNKISNVDLG
jgi:hypothetical protein